jgi:glutathione peroxidase
LRKRAFILVFLNKKAWECFPNQSPLVGEPIPPKRCSGNQPVVPEPGIKVYPYLNNLQPMTFKQTVLKKIYPLIMRLNKSSEAKSAILTNTKAASPKVPFHQLQATQNNGQPLDFSRFKNKKVLLVNTASNCGFTGQYEELQALQERLQDRLVVIGFPANDFKEQEKGTDTDIAQFCQLNFGVTFPLARKSSVVKGKEQHPVYQWLTNPGQNGWNTRPPDWNFSKYLVDEKGKLTHYFGPAVSPLSPEMVKALKS